MKYRVFFIVLFFSHCSFSQTFFGSQNIVIDSEASVDSPWSVHAHDMDNDGDLDIVAAFRLADKVAWFENIDGNGNFGDQQIISNTAYNVRELVVSDVDGDGNLDVIYVSGMSPTSQDDKIVLHKNNGLDFTEEIELMTGITMIKAIAFADVDSDNDPDLIFNNSTGTNWSENTDGLGNFAGQFLINEESDTSIKLSPADIDNDGDIDLVIAYEWDDKITWHENDGLGTFSDEKAISNQANGVNNVGVSDLDGDGMQDVFASYGDFNRLVWFKNENGLGDFSEELYVALGINQPETVNAQDMDNDGDKDIVFTARGSNASNPNVFWAENLDGLGSFGEEEVISNAFSDPKFSVVADMDNDGNQDIVVAGGFAGVSKIGYFKNVDGTGDFENIKLITKPYLAGVSEVHLVDINGDGNLDLLTGASGTGFVSWQENLDGLGNFSAPNVIAAYESTAIKTSVFAADFDGDADLDVAYLSSNDRYLFWAENLDGLGNFGTPNVIDISSSTSIGDFLISTDIDNDDDNDILVIRSNDAIVWYDNDGTGNFSIKGVEGAAADARHIVAEDVDGDGDQDVVVAAYSPSRIAWYENTDGLGGFSDEIIISDDLFAPTSVAIDDMDNDGKLDVIVATEEDKLFWLQNIGNFETFSSSKIISQTVDFPNNVITADLDNDGDADVISTSEYDNSCAWYENIDGLGNFGVSQVISAETEGIEWITVGDIDKDGDLDIVSASKQDNKIAWYENLFDESVISGYCFFDINENQIRDTNEIGLLNNVINLSPTEIAQFTKPNGEFDFVVENGNYELAILTDENWQLTTDSATYSINIQDTTLTGFNFGLSPIEIYSSVFSSITSAPTRCGFTVPFWINYENTGTTFNGGYVSFQIDPLASVVSTTPLPDSIDGDFYFWHYENLPPFASGTINVVLEMPGVDEIGTTLFFNSVVYMEDEFGTNQLFSDYKYFPIINCAYDPNDKQVQPPGIQEEGFTLFGEEFEYIIRFQNTGTDTAFTVRLADQLDDDLDWTTFRPIAASHEYQVTLTADGKVEFLFENILLPDSTTNEIKSHGFAKYRISPLNNLAEETPIHNFADIFFDFNPPIETNTTLNTLVSELPVNTIEKNQNVTVQVFPNPFDKSVNFSVGNIPTATAKLIVTNLYGKTIASHSITSNSILEISEEDWHSGIYFYQLIDEYSNSLLISGKIMRR